MSKQIQQLTAALADKDRDIAVLRGRLADMNAKHPEESCYAVAVWDRLRGKIAALVQVLMRYGQHDPGCPALLLLKKECVCGLDQAASAEVTVTGAIVAVLAERRRQTEGEGFTEAEDDEQADGALAKAAGCYALYGQVGQVPPDEWPFDAEWWKPRTRRRDLVRAAALLIAEIERLDRQQIRDGLNL